MFCAITEIDWEQQHKISDFSTPAVLMTTDYL